MRTSINRHSVSILTNLIPPYRMPLYGRLGEHFRLSVVLSGGESNRAGWEKGCEALPHVEVRQAAGTTLAIRKGRRRQISDLRYLAINPGYLTDLVRSAPDAVISSEMGLRTLCAILYGWLFGKPVWVMSEGTPHTEASCGLGRRC